MARKSCGAPALREERGATWYFRSPVEFSGLAYAAERPGHALPGAFRVIEDGAQQIQHGPHGIRVVHLELSGKDKRSPAAADEVDEDVHGVSLKHGTFFLGFSYGFQQDEGVARMDS